MSQSSCVDDDREDASTVLWMLLHGDSDSVIRDSDSASACGSKCTEAQAEARKKSKDACMPVPLALGSVSILYRIKFKPELNRV